VLLGANSEELQKVTQSNKASYSTVVVQQPEKDIPISKSDACVTQEVEESLSTQSRVVHKRDRNICATSATMEVSGGSHDEQSSTVSEQKPSVIVGYDMEVEEDRLLDDEYRGNETDEFIELKLLFD